jgi:hypothetical protein
MRLLARRSAATASLLTAALVAGVLTTAPASAAKHAKRPSCVTATSAVKVPGAEKALVACLPDLTTAGLTRQATGRYTDEKDWAGLHVDGTPSPTGVPGMQVDGYFPDTSKTNTTHGWAHDAQFVLRMPDRWNGGLVVTGAPGNREQYANDFLISDFVLAKGFAFASTDKGNTGLDFYNDGVKPGDAIVEWHDRVTELTRAAKAAVRSRYGRVPSRTYMAGISNGGYLVRWQLENNPQRFSGGVDWEGTLLTADGPNLLTYLPTAVRYIGGQATAADMHDAGFPATSEPLWPFHATVYWGLTQKIYRAELDPTYDVACPGASVGTTLAQILAPCASDADYDYALRPQAVKDAMARVSLTGKIKRPLITLHGIDDALLPISTDSDVYDEMVEDQRRARLHRYYVVEGGNHVDGLVAKDPEHLRPMLPCFRTAFDALTTWVTTRKAPPADGTIERPAGQATDPALRDGCALP